MMPSSLSTGSSCFIIEALIRRVQASCCHPGTDLRASGRRSKPGPAARPSEPLSAEGKVAYPQRAGRVRSGSIWLASRGRQKLRPRFAPLSEAERVDVLASDRDRPYINVWAVHLHLAHGRYVHPV